MTNYIDRYDVAFSQGKEDYFAGRFMCRYDRATHPVEYVAWSDGYTQASEETREVLRISIDFL